MQLRLPSPDSGSLLSGEGPRVRKIGAGLHPKAPAARGAIAASSSVVEHCSDTAVVAGSTPVSPTESNYDQGVVQRKHPALGTQRSEVQLLPP